MASDEPDEETVQQALILARSSRQGSRRFGSHVIERLAQGLPVREEDVRAAISGQLDQVAKMIGADVLGEDAGWQARQDVATRAAREVVPGGWKDLVDAVDEAPQRPDPPRSRKRQAFAGLVHALGGGQEALGEDLVEMIGLFGPLTEEEIDKARRAQRAAELNGTDLWGPVADQLSVHNLRRVAAAASLDHLRRATTAVMIISAWQSIVVLVGILDIAGSRVDLGEHLNRINANMVRQLQADPMWPFANMYRLSPKPKRRIQQLVLSALGILAAGQLEAWEAYQRRLLELTHPGSSTIAADYAAEVQPGHRQTGGCGPI